MPNNEMDYSLIHRTPDGNGKILVTTPGSPDKGSWETEAELKTYVNQDTVMKTDIMQSLGQQVDKVPSNKAVDDAINAINTRVTNIEETLMGENEITVQYPDDGNYSSLMPNKVPLRALKFAEVPRFRGKSRAWNQLANPNNYTTSSYYGVTVTIDGNALVFNGTATANEQFSLFLSAPPAVIGHKYLIMGAKGGIRIRLGQDTSVYDTGNGAIDTASLTTSLVLATRIIAGDSYDNVRIEPIIRDLTLIFGSGNEPSTVAEALAQLPALGQYNAYDAGSLVDTVVSGVKAVGVNIWDEEWENGTINLSTGADVPSSSYVRSKGYIEVTPLSMLYFCMAVGQRADGMYVCYYDDNKNFIRPVLANSANALVYQMPFNCRYIRFYMAGGYGSTYNHDIQICLNSYADKTTYHPYKTDTLSLPEPVTLKSAGSVAEVLTLETGKKTRPIGSVDLGDFSWSYVTDAGRPAFWLGTLADAPLPVAGGQQICAGGYSTNNPFGTDTDKIIYVYEAGGSLAVVLRDSAITNSSSFSGMMLNYELATPLSDEQVCDPIPDNFIEVEGGGTVETIQTQTPVIDNCLDVTYDIIPQ